jgi:ribokinase
MSLASCKKHLQNFLNEPQKKCRVVVLPDFFLDRLINLQWDAAEFSKLISDVAGRKGGSLDGVPQTDIKGGNAINIASALVNLGVEVTPIICTSDLGLQQIKYHFRELSLNTSHIKTCGSASMTTALELNSPNGKTNIMLRDLGALTEFGPDNLNEKDYALLEEADYTCLFNWAGTLKHGTALAKAVFSRARLNGKSKTYYGTADPTPNAKAIPHLIEEVLKTDKVDVLSVNENEAVTYASFLDESIAEKKTHMAFADLALEAARVLAKHFSARVDLHTTAFSATVRSKRDVIVPSFKVKTLRATGAGDAWDAGNIFGDYHGLPDECRLMLANALSACYLSNSEGMHPTKPKLQCFLKSME